MKVVGKFGFEKVFCPKCKKGTDADLHVPLLKESLSKSEIKRWAGLDIWICWDCDKFIDRDDF